MPIGYDPRYGGIPNLPTAGNLASSQQSIINQAIPGFNGLTKSASSIIGSALSGEVPQDVQDQIQNAHAEQAVMNGMPGSSRFQGTLAGNGTLRDLGLTSLQRQDTGVKDLLGMLQGYSGTVAPTVAQNAEQGNARAQYAAAPIPVQAQNEQERIYTKYANPSGSVPWWARGKSGPFVDVQHTPYLPGSR